jgi:hypothetical protein
MSNLNRGIIYFLVLSFNFGCASFPKKRETSSLIKLTNIQQLNGKYSLREIYSGPTKDTASAWNFSESDLGHYPTFFDELNNGMFVKQLKTDASNSYTFTLNILNSKRIEINYFKDDCIINQNTIRYKFKDDGYFYLKNRNFKIKGIPYVLGGFFYKRNRITLNKDNNLLFETSEFMSVGMFLLRVAPFSKMKYEKIYQRLE